MVRNHSFDVDLNELGPRIKSHFTILLERIQNELGPVHHELGAGNQLQMGVLKLLPKHWMCLKYWLNVLQELTKVFELGKLWKKSQLSIFK